jgi:hypothetical protein
MDSGALGKTVVLCPLGPSPGILFSIILVPPCFGALGSCPGRPPLDPAPGVRRCTVRADTTPDRPGPTLTEHGWGSCMSKKFT